MKHKFTRVKINGELLDGFSVIDTYDEAEGNRLTRAMVHEDFNYYLDERARSRMTGKAWAQYQRSREIHGAQYAYREYVSFHAQNLWEERFPDSTGLCQLHRCPMNKCDDVIAAAHANNCDFATAAANLHKFENLHKSGSAS